LTHNGLRVEERVRNTGDKTIPFGTGRHPAFRTLTTPDKSTITVDANILVV
jgi:galactose mutarotase-like enzyme